MKRLQPTDMNQTKVRLPLDVKQWLARQCKLNASTQNGEIVRSVRERMARETATNRPAA